MAFQPEKTVIFFIVMTEKNTFAVFMKKLKPTLLAVFSIGLFLFIKFVKILWQVCAFYRFPNKNSIDTVYQFINN